jgi:hypothetical protein
VGEVAGVWGGVAESTECTQPASKFCKQKTVVRHRKAVGGSDDDDEGEKYTQMHVIPVTQMQRVVNEGRHRTKTDHSSVEPVCSGAIRHTTNTRKQ